MQAYCMKCRTKREMKDAISQREISRIVKWRNEMTSIYVAFPFRIHMNELMGITISVVTENEHSFFNTCPVTIPIPM